jgi:hypothetical protein
LKSPSVRSRDSILVHIEGQTCRRIRGSKYARHSIISDFWQRKSCYDKLDRLVRLPHLQVEIFKVRKFLTTIGLVMQLLSRFSVTFGRFHPICDFSQHTRVLEVFHKLCNVSPPLFKPGNAFHCARVNCSDAKNEEIRTSSQ